MLRRNRQQRTWTDIASDPHTPYMIGRLLGANEMAVMLLARPEETQTANNISEVLHACCSYFLEDVPTVTSEPVTRRMPAIEP